MLADAHAAFGDDFARMMKPRSMMSWTTDLEVAKTFADGGTVFTTVVKPGEAIVQTLEGAGEAEVLIRHMIQATKMS